MSVTVSAEPYKVDNQQVEAFRFKPDQPSGKLALMYEHGWNRPSNAISAIFMAHHGYDVLTVNFRGHNGSEGDFETVTRHDAVNDVVAGHRHYKEMLPPDYRIGFVANSYGAYAACIGSLLCEDVACMSLRVPADYPDEGYDEPQFGQGQYLRNGELNLGLRNWRKQERDHAGSLALDALYQFAGHVQLIEAEHDEFIPQQTVQNFHTVAAARLEVQRESTTRYELMLGAPHLLGGDADRIQQFNDLLLNWLETDVKPVQ